MGSRLLLAGNGLALSFTVSAFLQLLSWPIAGVLILVSTAITSFIHTSPRRTASHPSDLGEANQVQGNALEQPKTRAQEHILSKEVKETQVVPRPVPSPKLARQAQVLVKRPPPTQTSPVQRTGGQPPVLKEGEYLTFGVELNSGELFVGEVEAGGVVDVYLLNKENLTSLDLGQEFWYETGSEGVQKATLHFTAPEKGKWFFVVENADTKELSAKVRIRPNIQSQPQKS